MIDKILIIDNLACVLMVPPEAGSGWGCSYKVFRHICVNCYKFGVPIRKFFFKKTSYS